MALPAGIGMLAFAVPGSPELMAANVESLETRRAVVWGKHLLAGGRGEGLTLDEMRSVKVAFDVETDIV